MIDTLYVEEVVNKGVLEAHEAVAMIQLYIQIATERPNLKVKLHIGDLQRYTAICCAALKWHYKL